jgi:hypothetical protein
MLVHAGDWPKMIIGSHNTRHSQIDQRCFNDAAKMWIILGGANGGEHARSWNLIITRKFYGNVLSGRTCQSCSGRTCRWATFPSCCSSMSRGSSTCRTEPRKPSSTVVPGTGGGLHPIRNDVEIYGSHVATHHLAMLCDATSNIASP